MNKKRISAFTVIFLFSGIVFFALPPLHVLGQQSSNVKDEVFQLNDAIAKKQQEIEELQRQTNIYKQNISQKQQEATSLGNQLSIIENRMRAVATNIKTTQREMELTKLEIERIEIELAQRNREMTVAQEQLAESIRSIDQLEYRSALESFFSQETLADFFSQMDHLENLQREIARTLGDLRTLRLRLEASKLGFIDKKNQLDSLGQRLQNEELQLTEEQAFKETTLEKTRSSEQTFQTLLAQLRTEQQVIDAEIANLERAIRERLEKLDTGFEAVGSLLLSWPVPPDRGISAYFHDPSYPFRHIFEHPAIDIRAGQGTPIRAAAPGYVARAKDAGMGYSYIMIIHHSGFATVYGHVSKILVQEDTYVERGQTIGLVGGMPGTPGAGSLTTGPHLHFEVRLNGIPVNPLEYLL